MKIRTTYTRLKLAVAVVTGLALAALSCKAESKATAPPNPGISSPTIAGCPVFPPDNPWNTDISKLTVHSNSANFINSIGAEKPLHPDFGTVWQGAPNGIPYVIVKGDQPKVPVTFEYAHESDPGPYPIPDDAPIEGGPNSKGDRHILIIDRDNCKLFELWHSVKTEDGWRAGSGAIFDLTSNKLRPMGWTSSDAAGLPIFPGLVRYDEVEQGAINHALRFTVERSQRAYILPATHYASPHTDPNLPPMGLRLRLKADYDISGFPPQTKVILQALKTYGMIVADNGGDWYITGAPDERWDEEDIETLKRVKGKEFEVVDTGEIVR